MNTNILRKFSTSIFLAGTMLFLPISTYAIGLPSIHIGHDGKIIISGAEVTSVSGDTITGVINVKNATTSATIKTNSETKISAQGKGNEGSTAYASSSIKVGDILNISGIFTGLSSSLTLTAEKIRNLTSSLLSLKSASGKVESVNTANGSFMVRTKGGKLLTVTTNATTTFYLSKKATSTLANTVRVNANMSIRGTLNQDGSVMLASTVKLNDVKPDKQDEQGEKKNVKSQKENKRFFGIWKHEEE